MPGEGVTTLQGYGHTRTELARWHAGDEEALGRLITRLRPAMGIHIERVVRRVANESIRRRLSAEDILQEAMQTVVRKLVDFEYRGPGSLCGWMTAVAINTVNDRIDHWSAGKRHPANERPLETPSPDGTARRAEPLSPAPGPATNAAKNERLERVQQVLASLPDADCRLIMMRTYYDATWAEVAADCGAPSADAARKRHARLIGEVGLRLSSLR